MEGFQRVHDDELILHSEASAITSTADGSVSGTPTTHETGPGIFAPGTDLMINVKSADDTDGDETYFVNFLTRREAGTGSWRNMGRWEIPRGTTEQVFMARVTNRYWDGVPDAELKVEWELGGTTPSLDATARLVVTQI